MRSNQYLCTEFDRCFRGEKSPPEALTAASSHQAARSASHARGLRELRQSEAAALAMGRVERRVVVMQCRRSSAAGRGYRWLASE